MLAAAITLSLFAFVLLMVVDIVHRDGRKIAAALEGRSLVSQPVPTRPVTVRFSQQGMGAELRQLQPALRAAA